MDENPHTPPRADSQPMVRREAGMRGSNLRDALWSMLASAVVIGFFGSALLGDKNPLGFLIVFASPFVGLVLYLIVNAAMGRDNEHEPDSNASADGIEWLSTDDADRLRDAG